MSALAPLETLLAARTLWHAGRSAAIAADGEPTGPAGLDALLPQGGWPRRALTELLLPADGMGELSLLLPTLARCTRAGERVVLVAPPFLPYAPAWQAAGVDLAQLRIVQATPRDALWAFEQCLRSGACAAVLGWPQQADARALRRLQVAADSGQCMGFALRERRHLANASPAALRIEAVESGGAVAWQVRKCRGGPAPARPFVMGPACPSAFAGVRAGAPDLGEGRSVAAVPRQPAPRPRREALPAAAAGVGQGHWNQALDARAARTASVSAPLIRQPGSPPVDGRAIVIAAPGSAGTGRGADAAGHTGRDAPAPAWAGLRAPKAGHLAGARGALPARQHELAFAPAPLARD